MNPILDTFFAAGGLQLNITVINRHDLENAMREPDLYSHVLVRVGGWAAKFVELTPVMQREILARTLY